VSSTVLVTFTVSSLLAVACAKPRPLCWPLPLLHAFTQAHRCWVGERPQPTGILPRDPAIAASQKALQPAQSRRAAATMVDAQRAKREVKASSTTLLVHLLLIALQALVFFDSGQNFLCASRSGPDGQPAREIVTGSRRPVNVSPTPHTQHAHACGKGRRERCSGMFVPSCPRRPTPSSLSFSLSLSALPFSHVK